MRLMQMRDRCAQNARRFLIPPLPRQLCKRGGPLGAHHQQGGPLMGQHRRGATPLPPRHQTVPGQFLGRGRQLEHGGDAVPADRQEMAAWRGKGISVDREIPSCQIGFEHRFK